MALSLHLLWDVLVPACCTVVCAFMAAPVELFRYRIGSRSWVVVPIPFRLGVQAKPVRLPLAVASSCGQLNQTAQS